MKNRNTTFVLLSACMIGLAGIALADTIFLEASNDSWVNGWTGTADGNNYGTSATANLRHQNATWGNNYALYTFDFSTLPENAVVSSVRMRFYTTTAVWPTTPANFAPIAIFNNTEDWDESTVVFTNAPTYAATATETLDHFGLTGNPVYFTGTNTIVDGTAGWLEFQSAGTVALVQGWADGTIDNYGISMMGTGDDLNDGRLFVPRTKDASESVRPEIVVDYTIIPEPATLGLIGFVLAGLLMVRRFLSV